MSEKPDKKQDPTPPEPVDISDGIPDRSVSISWAVVATLVAIFIGWCIFLLYCQYGGMV